MAKKKIGRFFRPLTAVNGPPKKVYLQKNPNVAAEIEKVIRDQALAITKELEGNPSPNEKISDKKEEE